MNTKAMLDDFFPYLAVGAFVVLFAVVLMLYGATQTAAHERKAYADVAAATLDSVLPTMLRKSSNDVTASELIYRQLVDNPHCIFHVQNPTENCAALLDIVDESMKSFDTLLPGKRFIWYLHAELIGDETIHSWEPQKNALDTESTGCLLYPQPIYLPVEGGLVVDGKTARSVKVTLQIRIPGADQCE